jgi:hypothetical protein
MALEQAGLIDSTIAGESIAEENTNEEAKDRPEPTEKEKLDRGKIRRSIHRTLRDAHVPTQHRSRKGKESTTSAKESEEIARDDQLSRGTGSFVIHGKKASVITFGDALANMSTDERLRHKMLAQNQDPAAVVGITSAPLQLEFASESSLRSDHRDSSASTNTLSARSFRELHKRLSAHAATLESGEASGEESDAAVSLSDAASGARTPLPPGVVIEEESDEGGGNMQAALYTPEVPGTPAKSEKGKGAE